MEYSFNTDLAERFKSSDIATIIHNLAFWQKKNQANNKNFHDGKYWTYNSAAAFKELFPWLSIDQIKRILKKLKEAKVLEVGNYNKSSYDRTNWYTLVDKDIMSIYSLHCAESHDGSVDSHDGGANTHNETSGNARPIPDSKPNTKPDSKPDKGNKRFSPPSISELENYCKEKGIDKIFDYEIYFDQKQANGWTLGHGKKMKCWKSDVNVWNKKGWARKTDPNANPF